MKRQLVKPLEPIARRTRCSFLDVVNAYAHPTIVLGYPERLDPARLRHALARVLSDFGAFAGRLVRSRGDWYIEHGIGAAFETAESLDCCSSLGAALRTSHSKLLCPALSPIATLRGKGALFAARLTQTPDGSVLGVTWSHALCDNHSMMLLLRAWSLAYREQPYKRPFDVADREAYLNEHVPMQPSSETQWRILSWPGVLRRLSYMFWMTRSARRVVLDFSWSQITAIHAAAAGDGTVSPGDALCAHVFWTFQRLCRDIGQHFCVTINYRKNFGLPSNLLGNASDFVSTIANPGDGPAAIASALRASIEAFDAGSLTQRELPRLRASRPGLLTAWRLCLGEPASITLGLTNVSRAGHHQLVFATARPTFIHARPTDAPLVGAGMIFSAAGATGLTIDIVLPSKLVESLARERSWMVPTSSFSAAP